MKKIKYSLFALIGICVAGVSLSVINITRAWLSSGQAFGNQNLQASSVSNYFAAGDGSEEHPFIINQPIHMYNLAWLQARGIFDTTKTYFKVSDLSGNPVTIDFAGALTGTTTTTGALPPIGTDAHHFVGEFDGNGSVFKNVWVSSDPNDWKEKPIDIGDANVNTHVGFFGNIDQNDENKGIVKNFYLENIEVTSHVDSSFVGLIAGYSNSYTENIGVKNGKLSFKQGNQNYYKSAASLIGEIGEDVYWSDMPSDGSAGGELKIDPNSTDWPGNTTFNAVTSGTVQVPGSNPGTAYISSMMGRSAQGLTAVYKYNTVLNFETDSGKTIDARKETSTDALADPSVCSGEFWRAYRLAGDKVAITPTSGAPANTPTNTIQYTSTDENGNEIQNSLSIPKNCIWFKPIAPGTCGVSFTVSNMNSARFMSIYRYKRVNGNIPGTNNWQEIKMAFDAGNGKNKNQIIKNKTVIYYEIFIDDAEIKAGYEYCIGVSRSNTNSPGNFFFLYLAGSNEHGGPSDDMAFLKNLDYVYKYNGQYYPSFTDSNYKPNHLKLWFEFFATSDDIVFLYNMDDIQGSTNVYYYQTEFAVLHDAVKYESVGVRETTTTRFPARQQT